MADLYKIGRVVSIGKTYIIFETNNVGSIIYTPSPLKFKKDWVGKVYVYDHRTDYVFSHYGFRTMEERELFSNLLTVKGVGPKAAISLLEKNINYLSNVIKANDSLALTKIKGIGKKTAIEIIFKLKPILDKVGE